MTKASLDLTGTWDGVYFYKDVPDAGPTTPFLAIIRETSGAFSGIVTEPHELREGTISATIFGNRQGTRVQFAKDYDCDDEEYQETVQYSGELSPDGQMVTGDWAIEHWSGSFEMTRAPGLAETVERKESAEIEL
jgi:hypothetical protein